MKSKIIYLFTALLTCVLCVAFFRTDDGTSLLRIHQHLEALPQTEAESSDASVLPVVMISTGGIQIPGAPILGEGDTVIGYTSAPDGSDVISASFGCVHEAGSWNTPDGYREVECGATIRCRGNSSLLFDKLSYMVHFVNEDGTKHSEGLMGMEASDEWILNGPFLDRTLIRNYMCLNIAGEIMDYAPDVRFCELYLDGEYQGLYIAMESISRGEGRIEITAPSQGKAQTSYIVRLDRIGKSDVNVNDYLSYIGNYDVSAMDVSYPGKNGITDERVAFIADDLSKIEKSLYSYDFDDPARGYSEYMDRGEYANYFIINEFFRNVDAGYYSTYFYKDVRGKMKPCVWDFNNACDNYAEEEWNEQGFTLTTSPWFEMLIHDKAFIDTVVYRYRQFRNGVLSEEYLMNYIDSTIGYLGDEVDKNYSKWGYVFEDHFNHFDYLIPEQRNYRSYDASVTQLKAFICKRGDWMDEHIDSLYQYCSESKIKELRPE